uniref:AlNc14C168G7951 protein n=1 Tax=Albugo laibachii Nc14 TaxID=890382 RepID=F0WNC0_9STRA|nr:AlNc14C168G7951 [Albugo laibachii Nc14]|eukprot:CCA22810.1 AlNc14C168G7951 [Albugo laibachii Nc14]
MNAALPDWKSENMLKLFHVTYVFLYNVSTSLLITIQHIEPHSGGAFVKVSTNLKCQ